MKDQRVQRSISFYLSLVTAILGYLGSAAPASADPLYGRRVVTPDQPDLALKAALNDLQMVLKEMTGQEFTLTTGKGTTGIAVLRASDPLVPVSVRKALRDLGREAFHLQPDGERLWIVANTDAGLCHGIYAYLDQLGCRWFFPSERWQIIPRRDDIRVSRSATTRPAFVSRMFFGTGGFGGALPCDPKMTIQGRWLDWQRRNRFGGEFLLAGHSGEAFNAKHRQVLEEHPEYRALVNGQRVPYSAISKFCASNEEVLQLSIADRLESLRLQRRLDPDGPRSFAVSVEPADGGGHCECPACQKLGTVSDRVFHVANRVARAVADELPDAHVSLYAYNEHAAVAGLKLEPNVYVTVIPYAFQRTGLSPDQLLKAWSTRVKRMSVYDYWSIPDWNHDLPTFDFLHHGPARLRFWHATRVEGFNCESTFSAGAMGPAWYVAGRLAWDPQADEQAIVNEFLELAFGPARKPMQRMLYRWADGFCLTSHEVALSFRDVDEAWRLADGKPEIQARVADYGRYVEYLRRRMEYEQADAAARHASALRLLEYVWNIYDSAMVHSFRLSQLVARDESRKHPEVLGRYELRKPEAPGWQAIRPLDDTAIRQLVHAGIRDHAPREFNYRRYSGKLVRLTAPSPSDDFSAVLFPASTQVLDVQVPAGKMKLNLRLACQQPVRVTVTNTGGKVMHEETVTTGASWLEKWSEVNIPVPSPGDYRVEMWSPKRTFRLSVPLEVGLGMPGWVNSQGRPTPMLYFYVPPGTKQLALYTPYVAAGPPRFFDPHGKEVKPELADGGRLMLLDIPVNQAGAVWSLDRAKAPNVPIRMLNAPNSFAFSPETLLVPESSRFSP